MSLTAIRLSPLKCQGITCVWGALALQADGGEERKQRPQHSAWQTLLLTVPWWRQCLSVSAMTAHLTRSYTWGLITSQTRQQDTARTPHPSLAPLSGEGEMETGRPGESPIRQRVSSEKHHYSPKEQLLISQRGSLQESQVNRVFEGHQSWHQLGQKETPHAHRQGPFFRVDCEAFLKAGG